MNFLAGFFVGALFGGAAGLLLAPSGGTELQERVRSRLEELAEEGRKAAAARQAELEAQLEAFKSGEAVTIEATPKSS
jgi:gas vesicle protein